MQRIWVVGVTTDHDEFDPLDLEKYPPDLYVAMPYAKDGSSPTTFTDPCAAKLSWFEPFLRSSLKPTGGRLPQAALRELLERLDAYIAKLAAQETN